MTKRQGRPLKLTEELSDEFVRHVERGLYMRTAAALVGVRTEAVYDWIRRGRRILDETTIEDLEGLEGDPYVLADFSLRVGQAVAQFEGNLVDRVAKGTTASGDPDWRASLALLRARFPGRWSETRKLILENPDEGPKDDRRFDLRGLAVDKLETIVGTLKEALVEDDDDDPTSAPIEGSEGETE